MARRAQIWPPIWPLPARQQATSRRAQLGPRLAPVGLRWRFFAQLSLLFLLCFHWCFDCCSPGRLRAPAPSSFGVGGYHLWQKVKVGQTRNSWCHFLRLLRTTREPQPAPNLGPKSRPHLISFLRANFARPPLSLGSHLLAQTSRAALVWRESTSRVQMHTYPLGLDGGHSFSHLADLRFLHFWAKLAPKWDTLRNLEAGPQKADRAQCPVGGDRLALRQSGRRSSLLMRGSESEAEDCRRPMLRGCTRVKDGDKSLPNSPSNGCRDSGRRNASGSSPPVEMQMG